MIRLLLVLLSLAAGCSSERSFFSLSVQQEGNEGRPAADSDTVRRLVVGLRSDDLFERTEAHRQLKELDEDSIPDLKRYENDRDPEVKTRIRSVIRFLDSRRRPPPLKGFLTMDLFMDGTVKIGRRTITRLPEQRSENRLETVF